MRKGTPTKAAKSTRRPAKDARRLTREDWVEAALAALARGGVAAVAVEPLASELGATKGSFYWHFADRGELLKAVLERWVARDTDEVIAAMDALPDARAKLSAILSHGLAGEFGGAADAALLASAENPLVAAALQRAHARRLAYTEALFAQLGFGDDARRRALLCYAVYVGSFQLRRVTPALAGELGQQAYIAHVIEAILGGAGAARDPTRGPRR